MYQHSPDRNAVFGQYAIPKDWSYDAKANVNSGMALVGNTLLFTTFSHQLVALDVRSGRELWQAPVTNIAMSTPIVAGNTVFIGTGANGMLHRNLMQKIQFRGKDVWGVPDGDEVAAFDLRTGAPRWTYHTVGEDMPSAVYDGGRIIFANGDWHAYALRADNGAQIWSTDVGGASTMASAVTAGKAVIVATCASVTDTESIALDPSSGKILWRSQFGNCDAAPAYANGKVFVSDVLPGDSSLQKITSVAALNANTGKPVWTYRAAAQGLWSIVGSDEQAIAGTYADGTYYQPAEMDDQLLAFDADTGKVRWRFHTSGPAKMSPVVMNGRLYIGDTAGMFYTLNARNGDLLEIREFKKPFSTSPPVVAGNKILVVNGTTVNAIPLTGRPAIPERVGWGITTEGRQMNGVAAVNNQ
ncbi:MAG TPA: PQQ-binding-like beta-propeller repeat protein [Candidatus Baltobacteraceae bacterium]|nr:PQQ-binding-like beta-propeller repeat protein [Candidatus Baltobacteraceae bacterium]